MTAPTTEQQETALTKITTYMEAPAIRERFAGMLGERGASTYISSVLIACANSDKLQNCEPKSIYISALRAATLRLSVDPSTGQAYMVPYGRTAQLIVGYKGLHDLAVRTGKYEYINCAPIYEGEEVIENRITGFIDIATPTPGGNEIRIDPRSHRPAKDERKIIGWLSSFKLHTGYRHDTYMSVEEIHEHAQRYSKGYGTPNKDGVLVDSYGKPTIWHTERPKMERKTVLRMNLRHWGYLDPADVQMLDSLDADTVSVESIPENDVVDAILSERSAALDEQDEAPRSREQNLRELGFVDADPFASDPEPEPQNMPEFGKAVNWSDAQLDALITNGLAKNEFGARGMLGLSNLPENASPSTIKLWGTLYREQRPLAAKKGDPTAQEAAEHANVSLPRSRQ